MPTQLQLRGGTTLQNASFTGLAREVTVDTTKHTLIVHDGTTVGGHELTPGATYSISAETTTGGVNLRLTGSNSTTDDVKLAAGSNVSLTRTDANTITIASTGSGATYGISAETATGGVNLRLTGSDSSTDDVKLAAGTNITLTRTDANTVTIEAAGGAGSGTVNSGVAKKLAYYSATGTAVDDVAGIEWDSATTTLTVTGTVAADNFVSGGTGTPNFTSDTDLEIITNASGVTPKTFTFKLDGSLEIAEDAVINMQGAGTNAIQALGALDVGAGGILNLISLSDVTLSPGSPGGSAIVDGTFRVGEAYGPTPTAKTFEIETGLQDRILRAISNMSSFGSTVPASVDLTAYRSAPANGNVGVSISFRQSVTASANFLAASVFSKVTDITSASEDTTLNFSVRNAGAMADSLVITGNGITVAGSVTFGSTVFRVVGVVPTTSVGAAGNKAGDVAMNGTSIFYCTADYDGTSNIWVKSAWTSTGAW